VRSSWNGSGEDFVTLDGIASAVRTVGFALMSSGMLGDGIDGGNGVAVGEFKSCTLTRILPSDYQAFQLEDKPYDNLT